MIRILAFLTVFAIFPAMAQIGCQERPVVIEWLEKEFQEQVTGVGVTNDGKLVEFVSSNNGKTWTLMFTTSDGLSCLIAAGQDWTNIRQVPLGRES